MIQSKFPIIKVAKQNENCFEITFKAPEMANEAKVGQFVNILCDGKTLRRPISICRIDKENGTLRIVFERRGEGTTWLAERSEGEDLDILGPLGGNGFPISADKKKVLVVGGGIGVPPLLGIADFVKDGCDAVLGYKDKDHLCLVDDFKASAGNTFIMTDDGSFGEKGFVTQRVASLFEENNYDAVYACGPAPMLKAVSAIAEDHNTDCYISLEERMGCGIGACLVCACKIMTANGEKHLHVCKDGPVFKSTEVIW